MRTTNAILALALGSIFCGCERGEETEPARMTPASRTSPAAERAAGALAAARCVHERQCGNVGPTRKYMSQDHCMSVMNAQASKKVIGCRQGVDQSDLHECLNTIANEDCNSPLDSLERRVACRTSELCL